MLYQLYSKFKITMHSYNEQVVSQLYKEGEFSFRLCIQK